MFGKNPIVGRASFRDPLYDGPPRLMVTSVFYTFQGEGLFMGRPALFVRLTGCNLSCSFCDAYFTEGDWMTFDEIIEAANKDIAAKLPEGADVKEFTRKNIGLVVTGGEPTLQETLPAFLDHCQHKFAWTQIETNGTQNLRSYPKATKIIVSPKCSEKGGVAVKYLQPNDSIVERAAALKFVVTADPSSPYYDIPEWAKKSGLPVYISPMNVYARLPAKAQTIEFKGKADLSSRSTVDEVVSFWEEGLLDRAANQKNHEFAAQLCIRNGWIFNMQLHLYAGVA